MKLLNNILKDQNNQRQNQNNEIYFNKRREREKIKNENKIIENRNVNDDRNATPI